MEIEFSNDEERLKCMDCGTIFDYSYENGECCPKCGNDDNVYTVRLCKICEQWVPTDDIHGVGWVCNDCIYKYKYDIDTCYKIGERYMGGEITINPFLALMFSAADINEILLNILIKDSVVQLVDCTPFINIDRESFGDELRLLLRGKS